jgi:hypothetical protein
MSHDCQPVFQIFYIFKESLHGLWDYLVILPFLAALQSRAYAACFSFMAGVIPPMPMLGRSLL